MHSAEIPKKWHGSCVQSENLFDFHKFTLYRPNRYSISTISVFTKIDDILYPNSNMYKNIYVIYMNYTKKNHEFDLKMVKNHTNQVVDNFP